MPKLEKVVMEGVDIIFRNFAGKEGMYNREGDRNFSVKLDPDVAESMARDGWNIKYLKPREEGDVEQAYIQVSVSYKGRPPKIVMITSRGRNYLDEDTIELMDWADILNVDLILNPYEWAVNGKTGIKAYLGSIYITIQEDPLELKYADVLEVGAAPKHLELEGPDEYVDAEIVE